MANFRDMWTGVFAMINELTSLRSELLWSCAYRQTWGGGGKRNSEPLCIFPPMKLVLKDCTDSGIVWAFWDCQTIVWLCEEFFQGGFYWLQLENPSYHTLIHPHPQHKATCPPSTACLLSWSDQKARVHHEGNTWSQFVPWVSPQLSTIYRR